MKKLLIALALIPAVAPAQSTGQCRGPIIDVHLHAQTRESLAQPAPNPATGQMSPKTAEEHMTRSLEIMRKRNVVLGIVSGSSVAAVEPWGALDFLTVEEKQGVFYDNAAKYLGLTAEQIARHHR
jgi:hypothetical protein